MANGDTQIYKWTVGDVRKLDAKLDVMKSDIREIKRAVKAPALVVDNTVAAWNWKTISIIIGSVMATIILTVQQITK